MFTRYFWGWVIVFERLKIAGGVLLLGLFASTVLANEDEPLCDNPFCLRIVPTVCVTQTPKDKCEQELTLWWQAERQIQACAYVNNRLLQCWQPQSRAQWQGEIDWPSEGTISITDESGAIVAEAFISVQSLQPRRRLGSPWSVF
ncbi:DUF3019 domain-containing protein [Aliidiomarina celeris]|uniref:DUF3019 domain-containing protein n=1 Tax=Aliidiomarina celeris TaxID=2249428 RepID=UPI000DE927DB|nr:DUF3019 domain-containing protein [Aliidiomarina celeris]